MAEVSLRLKPRRKHDSFALSLQTIQAFLVCLYLVLPHHTFLHLGIESVLKPTDFVSVVIGILSFVAFKVSRWTLPFFCFCLWYLAVSIVVLLLDSHSGLLFGLKFLQYFVVINAVALLSPAQRAALVKVLVCATLLFSLLELAGVPIGLNWAGRLSAQFGGPYELSSILLLFLLFSYGHMGICVLVVFIGVALTDTKAAYISLAAWLIFIGFRQYSWRLLLPVIPMSVGAAFIDTRALTALGEAPSFDLYDLGLRLWESLPTVTSSQNYEHLWLEREENNNELDLSTWSRLYTYMLVLKSISTSTILIGNGPGYYGTAIDASILRVFVETGIVGLILILTVMKKIAEMTNARHIVGLLLIFVMLSDVLFSARFLTVLFLLALYSRDRMLRQENI